MTWSRGIVGILIIAMPLASCKTRRAVEKSPLFPLANNAVLAQLVENEFAFQSLNAKLDVSIKSPSQNNAFKMNLRMRKDSAIWMSITPALGIEAARVMIERDTLKFINKLKNEYYIGNYSILDSLMQYQTKFDFIENLLVGNPVEIEPDEKYTSIVDDLYYVIQTKVKRKLKKSVEIGIKQNPQDAQYGEVIKEKKYQKATEKFGDEDLIVKRYYVRAKDFRVAKTYIEDLLYQRSIRIFYDNYQEVNGGLLPHAIKVEVISPEETVNLYLDYSRLRLNESQSYPFKIPAKYDQVE